MHGTVGRSKQKSRCKGPGQGRIRLHNIVDLLLRVAAPRALWRIPSSQYHLYRGFFAARFPTRLGKSCGQFERIAIRPASGRTQKQWNAANCP